MNDKVLMCIVASLLVAPVGVSANKVANARTPKWNI